MVCKNADLEDGVTCDVVLRELQERLFASQTPELSCQETGICKGKRDENWVPSSTTSVVRYFTHAVGLEDNRAYLL